MARIVVRLPGMYTRPLCCTAAVDVRRKNPEVRLGHEVLQDAVESAGATATRAAAVTLRDPWDRI